jgi:YHS domain-containing protein
VQDPGFYLNQLGVSVPSLFDSATPAVLDSRFASFVDFEAFYFASAGEKQRFDRDIVKHCGIVTDPVSKERFRPTEQSPRMVYNDRTYLFASDSTHATFAMMPDMYWLPNYSMYPKSDSAL